MNEYIIELEEYKGYFVSTLGNVYSKRVYDGNIDYNRPYRKLKGSKNSCGYIMVDLYVKNLNIHRLVAKTFIDNPENKPCVDHINRIRTDNRVENLRWASRSENQRNRNVGKNNTTGFTGVREREERFCSFWLDDKGKKIGKSFSIKKYGYENARRLAINSRKKAEDLYYTIKK